MSLGLAAPLWACGSEAAPTGSDLALLATSTRADPVVPPATREGFLAVLAPAPSAAVRVTYDVRGPAGLSGELKILLLPGGKRRETWALELPLPEGGARRIEGTATQTADYAWTRTGEDLEVQRSPLGALADAYLAMPPSERKGIVDSLAAFRGRLATARAGASASVDEVLGVPCLATRLAAQDLCVWEETGLALSYRGNAFSLRARQLDLSADVAASAFFVPPEVERNAPGPDLDPDASLRRLARRDYAELGPLLHPGLRLPLG